MAFKQQHYYIFLAFAVLFVMCWNDGALAQSGCTTELTSLYPCLNYVSGNASGPSSTCCSQLAGVVRSQPRCLCLLLNGGASAVGINVNQTLALALPDKCNVQTPSASRCNGGSSPAPSPAAAGSVDDTPDQASSDTPSESEIPAGVAGSKTVPTINGSNSAGIDVAISSSFFLFGFLFLVASGVLSGA